jgi:flagellin FlaB
LIINTKKEEKMYQKLVKAIKSLHAGQRGMTGLETAIILIAFVTVASVLAYSVLSAGIFSAERGKETVYSGLESAQASMEIHGTVIGDAVTDNTSLDYMEFLVGLTIPDEKVDMTALVVNYYDSSNETNIQRVDWGSWSESSGNWTSQIAPGCAERGSPNTLEADELHVIKVDIPVGYTTGTYDTFTVEILPPTGAALTIKRTLPGQLEQKMDLK